jgi:hypothetical protein
VAVLASWLSDDQPPGTRTLDLYRHRDGEQLTRTRLDASAEQDLAEELTRMVIQETTP